MMQIMAAEMFREMKKNGANYSSNVNDGFVRSSDGYGVQQLL